MIDHQNVHPAPTTPPMIASEESTEEQLQFGRKQGDAYAAALRGMDKESGAQTVRAGEYEVVVVVENAEGMWSFEDGELCWMNPTDENAHVEVAVCDGADGRFIPGLQVQVTISAANRTQVGAHEQPFLWPPMALPLWAQLADSRRGRLPHSRSDRTPDLPPPRPQQRAALCPGSGGRLRPPHQARSEESLNPVCDASWLPRLLTSRISIGQARSRRACSPT